MNPETEDWAQIVTSLGAIRQELARLGERVAGLETAVGLTRAPAAPAPPLAPSKPEPEGLSEEQLLVISAAIAAYLGKRPHIRQVRLLGSAAWAQQGRVTIQASHSLSIHHR
jgi:methylmalonyl-CoA carboxyltransferase large subunit